MDEMTPRSGTGYFLSGFPLIFTPGLRSFVLIPLTVNLILFSVAFYWLFGQISEIMTSVTDYLPDFLDWLTAILWPVMLIGVLVLFSFIFSTVTNWLAAPFNGLLAEKVEAHLTGKSMDAGGGLEDVIKDIPRTFSRELTKLTYYIPRALGFLLLFLFLPLIGQVLWFLFTAWMMAVQYCDYCYDNHKIGFDHMKEDLRSHKGLSFSFGIGVTVAAMVPIVNLVVMPVAICGATRMCVERFGR